MQVGEVGVGLDTLEWRWDIHLPISYYRPGILLGTGNPAVSKTDRLPAFMELMLQWRRRKRGGQ